MHTPTKTQWQIVIDNFKKILPLTVNNANHLNMLEGGVNRVGHACGTIHCAGGWYAVATLDLTKGRVTFEDGGVKMAIDLGFTAEYSYMARMNLKDWAEDNPQIWGNEYGQDMFVDELAYDGAKNIPEIIQFLEGVRDRSPD